MTLWGWPPIFSTSLATILSWIDMVSAFVASAHLVRVREAGSCKGQLESANSCGIHRQWITSEKVAGIDRGHPSCHPLFGKFWANMANQQSKKQSNHVPPERIGSEQIDKSTTSFNYQLKCFRHQSNVNSGVINHGLATLWGCLQGVIIWWFPKS